MRGHPFGGQPTGRGRSEASARAPYRARDLTTSTGPQGDHEAVRRIAERLATNGWLLEVRGAEVHGPNAPTAGPPPYRIYRVTPDRAFGLPGNYGMDQFEPDEPPKPTRWDFAAN